MGEASPTSFGGKQSCLEGQGNDNRMDWRIFEKYVILF